MPEGRELRELADSQYDSASQFAKAIRLPRQRGNKITNGVKEPDVVELHILEKALHGSTGGRAQIFLR
mgnify:CR=1 FL=1